MNNENPYMSAYRCAVALHVGRLIIDAIMLSIIDESEYEGWADKNNLCILDQIRAKELGFEVLNDE